MDPIAILKQSGLTGLTDLTEAEEAALIRELAAAYHQDEAACSRRDIQRIAEKIRLRMAETAPAPDTTPTSSP